LVTASWVIFDNVTARVGVMFFMSMVTSGKKPAFSRRLTSRLVSAANVMTSFGCFRLSTELDVRSDEIRLLRSYAEVLQSKAILSRSSRISSGRSG